MTTIPLERHGDRVANFPPPDDRSLIQHNRPRIAVAVDDDDQFAFGSGRQLTRLNEHNLIGTSLGESDMLVPDDQ